MRSALSVKKLPTQPEPKRQPRLVYERQQRFSLGASIDRLLRSRFWIGLIAFALIGLVAMQVSLLRINAQSGLAAGRANDLARKNDELRTEVARLSASERIRFLAQKQGMVDLAPNQIRYLTASPHNDAKVAAGLLTKTAPQQPVPSAPVATNAVQPVGQTGSATQVSPNQTVGQTSPPNTTTGATP